MNKIHCGSEVYEYVDDSDKTFCSKKVNKKYYVTDEVESNCIKCLQFALKQPGYRIISDKKDIQKRLDLLSEVKKFRDDLKDMLK